MTDYITPFVHTVNLDYGDFPGTAATMRRLSDLRGLFADAAAEAALLSENPVIYEVYYPYEPPEVEGQLGFCTTVIHPGTVGSEYFMTKGHFHKRIDRAEVYYGLKGEGRLILQTPEGVVNVQTMTPGATAFVPPYWGHRTMNVGSEDFVFLSVFPADAGYDYGMIADKGFASIIVAQDGKPMVVDNPRYKK
jgi:glucose-6-phosphate isomerase, archaeal